MPRPPLATERWISELRKCIAGSLPAIEDPEQASGLFLDLSCIYYASHDLGNAELAVDNAARLARTVAPTDLTPLLWPRLVDCRIRNGNRAGGRAAAVAALPIVDTIPDSDTRWWALTTLTERLATLRDTASLSHALALLRRSDGDRFGRDEGFTLRTRIALAAGKFEDAVRFTQKLPPDRRIPFQLSAASGLHRIGRLRAAHALMDTIWAAMRQQRNPGVRLLDESLFLEALVRQGRFRDALRLAQVPYLRDVTLEAMLTAGLCVEALKQNPKPSPSLVYALAGEGHRLRAEQVHRVVLREHKWFLEDEPVRMLAARAKCSFKVGQRVEGDRLVLDAQAVTDAAKGTAKRIRYQIALAHGLLAGGWPLDH